MRAHCTGCRKPFAVQRKDGVLVAVPREEEPAHGPEAGGKEGVARGGEGDRPSREERRTARRHRRAAAGPPPSRAAEPLDSARVKPPLPPEPEPPPAFGSGERVGRYEVEALLGRGGMGVVYRAFDPVTNRHVALKVLRAEASEQDRTRFQREIEVQGNVQHPHIMPIFDSGSLGGSRYYVMELLKEPLSLADLTTLSKSGAADRDPKTRPVATLEGIVRHVILPVCQAIHHANVREGVLHRDLKPGNVILDRNGLRPYVIDFGICTLLERKNARLAHLAKETPTPHPDGTQRVTGTLYFMPPEQARGQADRRGDVWAIGALLHSVVAGEPPLRPGGRSLVPPGQRIEGLKLLLEQAKREGNKEEEQQYLRSMEEIRAGASRSTEDLHRDVLQGNYRSRPEWLDPALDAVIAKAMAPDPSHRYRHALELHQDLLAWLEGRPVLALAERKGAAGHAAYRGLLLLKRHRLAVVLVAGLAMTAGLLWWLFPEKPREDRGRVLAERLATAEALERQGDRHGAREASRRVIEVDPTNEMAFALLSRLDGAERLDRDFGRARALRAEAEAAFRGGRIEEGERRLAALAEVLEQGVLPALASQPAAGRDQEVEGLMKAARGEASLAIRSPCGTASYDLLPVDPDGTIRWDSARSLVAVAGQVEGAAIKRGRWILRARAGEGEVLTPFAASGDGSPVEVSCPYDPSHLDRETLYVPGGRAKGPVGESEVSALLWDRTEVTAERYARFLESLSEEERARRVPRRAGAFGAPGRPLWEPKSGGFVPPPAALRRPVEGISLYDARAFARFEGKRLPTAAEWAFAAVGGDGRLCAPGPAAALLGGAARVGDPVGGAGDVMSSSRDRSPFGLYDMAGNVAEFTETLATFRGVNGWLVMGSGYAKAPTCALVGEASPEPGWLPLEGVGFRCVRPVPP